MGEIRIGTSGWHYASWRGLFYPADLPARDYLPFYAAQFSATEINASFYRLPSETAVRGWADHTPDGFLFAWKASRFITHYRRLRHVEASLALVFGRMAALGAKSGPVLFQLPPQMRIDRERLAAFLALLPRTARPVIEFRHPSWYDAAIFDLLHEKDVALCLSDHAAAPAPWLATARHVYVRAHGSVAPYAGSYGDATLADWAGRIGAWHREKRDVYCFFDNDADGAAPCDAKRLLTLLTRQRADAAP